jgi:hypothetical protein
VTTLLFVSRALTHLKRSLCSSGCNIKGVGYCQKFYPTATAIVDVPQVDIKDWKNAGFASGQSGPCNDSAPDGVGISGQAACWAPVN